MSVESVLMTADSIGGVWTYALQLAEEFGRRDIEVILVVMGGKPSADQAAEAAKLRNLSVFGTDLKLEWMQGAEADLELAGNLLLDIESERRPDVVHLNGYAHAGLPFRAPVLVAAHSDVATWWDACREDELPPEWDGYRRRVRSALAVADAVVAPSAAYLADLTARHGQAARSRVIHNGRDPARFAPGQKREMALAAGRLWDDAKNIAALCRAADGLSWPVLIAGDPHGPDGASVAMPPNVVALGRLPADDVRARMAEAAVFVSPARYEPFGLGVLEAALSGCALVLGDIPTLRELWADAALFVAPEDHDALRDTLEALLFDPEQAADLGRKARRVAARYSSAAMASGYLDLYGELVGARVARTLSAAS